MRAGNGPDVIGCLGIFELSFVDDFRMTPEEKKARANDSLEAAAPVSREGES
jgi:hypothetical protein